MMRFFLPASTLALVLLVNVQLLIPPAVLAAAGGLQTVASGKGSSNDDRDDKDDEDRDDDRNDDRSGKSDNSGRGRSSSDDRPDDDSERSSDSDDDSFSSSSSSSASSSSQSSQSSSTNSSSSSNSGDNSSSVSSSSDDGTNSSSSSSSSGGGASSSSSVTSSSRQIIAGKTRQQINGFQAEFSIRREVRFDREKFRAEASNLNLGAGMRLAVCFGGAALGDIVLNSLNYGELELDSRRGQAIPDFSGGETLELRQTSCGGVLVMSATFGGSSVSGPPSSSSPLQDNSLIEGKSRRLLDGFEAEFSVRLERRPDRDKFHAEAESLNLGTGTRLDVCFEGAALGDIFLNAFNYGELELDSRLGHSFPIFSSGDALELRQGGCSGTLVMATTFGESASPTGSASQTTSAARSEIEGKTRRVLQSFEAEFSVRFESRFDRDKIRAEVSNLNYPQGSLWTVCFGGSGLGSMRLNSIHFAELELDSRLGRAVPVLESGNIVSLHEGSSCSSDPVMSVRMGTGN